MSMELRLYNKCKCSVFDLIGKLEPHQTKSLGLLLSRSEKTLSVFLNLISLPKLNYSSYVVDCELLVGNSRYDILIRFYNNYVPIHAILIEAKGITVNGVSKKAVAQISNYASNPYLLYGFNNITYVTITKNLGNVNAKVKAVTWNQLINGLHAIKPSETIVKDYINYLTSMNGGMNYYEEEILSIPAGSTFAAIKGTGIYVCPNGYRDNKKTLYIAFREGKGGVVDRLYKLNEMFENVDLNDQSQIAILNNICPGIGVRIANYMKILQLQGLSCSHGVCRLYVLDIDNSIQLPNKVVPLRNNTNRAYYSLKEFVQPINSNKGTVVVQKDISLRVNEITIKKNKLFELYDSNNGKPSLNANGKYSLTDPRGYTIYKLNNKNNRKLIAKIGYDSKNNSWSLTWQK